MLKPVIDFGKQLVTLTSDVRQLKETAKGFVRNVGTTKDGFKR